MRIAIWRTEHEIADTVATALKEGIPNAEIRRTDDVQCLSQFDAHIAYGILRGTDGIFKQVHSYFELDRGYFSPSHYSGYYRISYRGTQARWHEGIPRKPWVGKLEPWRGFAPEKRVLVCPPTEAVCDFFGLDGPGEWVYDNTSMSAEDVNRGSNEKFIIRKKGDTSPINFLDYNYVLTFNSSVGWQALQRGIPVISDPEHSIVGSYYKNKYGVTDINSFTQNLSNMEDSRIELFEAMQAHQFTLSEIKQGKAWELIEYCLKSPPLLAPSPSSSGQIAANKSPLMSAPTPSENAPKRRWQSVT